MIRKVLSICSQNDVQKSITADLRCEWNNIPRYTKNCFIKLHGKSENGMFYALSRIKRGQIALNLDLHL